MNDEALKDGDGSRGNKWATLENIALPLICQRGRAFESVVSEHQPRVEALCRHVLGDPRLAVGDGGDVPAGRGSTPSVQEPFEQWMTRIAANVCGLPPLTSW
jgi:hypothetical protein